MLKVKTDIQSIFVKSHCMINGLLGDPQNGEEPKPLTHEQIKLWNKFMASKPKGQTLEELYAEFNNPAIPLQSLQADLNKLNSYARQHARRRGMQDAESVNTGFTFPELSYNGQNLGPVNRDMRTSIYPAQTKSNVRINNKVPSEIKELMWDETVARPYFINPKTGDIEYTDVELLQKYKIKEPVAGNR